jgi:hypothetical protein
MQIVVVCLEQDHRVDKDFGISEVTAHEAMAMIISYSLMHCGFWFEKIKEKIRETFERLRREH